LAPLRHSQFAIRHSTVHGLSRLETRIILRKIIRTVLRQSQNHELWLLVLLSLAVAVPAVCLLWLMNAAMRNEGFAVRQKLADVYRGTLSASQMRLQQGWKETAQELERLTTGRPAPAAFANCVRSKLVGGVVLYDEQGRLRYPNTPEAVKSELGALASRWHEAERREHLGRYAEAAQEYDALARVATNDLSRARAFQAAARCLVSAGKSEAAIQLVNEIFSQERYRHVPDPQGRLLAANTELMALELMTNRHSPLFQTMANRLAGRLMDYDNPALAAPQRRFLMKELRQLSPQPVSFPTLAAEELVADAGAKRPLPASDGALQRSSIPGWWQFTTPNRQVLALVSFEQLLATAGAAVRPNPPLTDAEITLIPPEMDGPDAFVTLPAGEQMPGWRLALVLKDRQFLDAMAGRQTAVYLWTGLLVVAVMGVLTLLTFRLLRRQVALARLKNDLAATVSHELKTPLSSIRVLVETLLDSERLEEPKTREYLELIAQENERLGRLIQNFLTFSRMEKKKYVFHFSSVAVKSVLDAAIDSMRSRLEAPGCRLDVQVAEPLPPILADLDALSAALSNLLENACKYSDDIKHIVVRAWAENGRVLLSVKDNGIGIAARERHKIFQPFYQTDQQLSRKGSGCGLGLSIVQFIVDAHRGSVALESHPGAGSTFTLSLPTALPSPPTPTQTEAIA
jgi:signal transduction histidine kinase